MHNFTAICTRNLAANLVLFIY